MSEGRIAAIGAYLPLLRLERRAARAALAWSGLGGPSKGHRAVAGWDEDALTLAAESARIAAAGRSVADVQFASTSAPFTERSHATLLVDALHLPAATRTLDVAHSRRCGVAALLRALERPDRSTLIAAGERRVTKAGSPLDLGFGDGGAAVLTGDEGGARLLGAASLSHDLVDIYASPAHPAPYQAEERFIREVAVNELLAPVIRDACAAAGIAPGAVARAVVPEPVAGSYAALARLLGLSAANAATALAEAAGDLGAAHPLFALALALDGAAPGEVILLVGFGGGCDALILEVTGETPGAASAAAALREGLVFGDYVRFLSLSGSLDLDWGARSEHEQKMSAAVLERHGRDMLGFVGGRDSLGNVQFPKSAIPVNPAVDGPERLDDVILADAPARIVSVTADRLNFTPDPPFHFGLIQFDNGARVLMEYTDAGPGGFAVADQVRMRLRVKSIDRRRGFRSYFWKAAPAARPLLEE